MSASFGASNRESGCPTDAIPRPDRPHCGEWNLYLVCAGKGEQMRLRALGASGVEVSAIGLGGYELGDGDNITIGRAREMPLRPSLPRR
jgi:hypothetical protein